MFGSIYRPNAFFHVFQLLVLYYLSGLSDGRAMPTVDPGLFMIHGVETCREGSGYCLLGLDCTLDDDFLPDDSGGHCNGLKTAFIPAAHFTCCKVNPDRPDVSTTKRPRPLSTQQTTTLELYTKNSTQGVTGSQSTEIPNPAVIEAEEEGAIDGQVEDSDDKVFSEKDVSMPTSTPDPDITTTATPVWEASDIFVDLNNEVFKEVIPPVLQDSAPDLRAGDPY